MRFGQDLTTLFFFYAAPPTYEQSMFEVVKAAKDKSEEADELPFKPMYATYTSNEDHNK